MYLLATSGLPGSAQIAERTSAICPTPHNFTQARERTGAEASEVSADAITLQVSAAPMNSAAVTPPSASVNSLLPKLDYAAKSLETLHVQVKALDSSRGAAALRNHLQQLDTQFKVLGSNLRIASGNDPIRLIQLQQDIYRVDEELELLSKVVDQTTSGIKSVLQTQV